MTEAIPELGIVIVSWNTRDLLLDCVASVYAHAPRGGVEIVIVDNASADGSAAAVRDRFPDAIVLENDRNLGFARAVNRGLVHGQRARFRLLLNSDCVLGPGQLDRLVEFMCAHPRAGAAGPALRHEDGRAQHAFDHFPVLATEILNKSLMRRLMPSRYPDRHARMHAPREVDTLIGACMMVRQETLDEVGLLDEGYFLFLEETDWCERMARAGWARWVVPDVRVLHRQGRSAARAPNRARVEFLRSLYRYFAMNRSFGSLFALRVLRPLRLAVSAGLEAVAYLLSLGLAVKMRRRLGRHAYLLAWHLCACPSAMGLEGWVPLSSDLAADTEAGTGGFTRTELGTWRGMPADGRGGESGWDRFLVPDGLHGDAGLIKDTSLKRVRRVDAANGAGALFWKWYKPRGVIEAFLPARFSRGIREFELVRKAAQRGAEVVAPVAAAAIVPGSVIVYPFIDDARPLDAVLRENALPRAARARLVETWGRFARRTLDAGVRQDDFDPNNVLVVGDPAAREPKLVLVDFERVRLTRGPVGAEDGAWLLAKLHRFRAWTMVERARFMRGYGGRRHWHDAISRVCERYREVLARDARKMARQCLRGGRNYSALAGGKGWLRHYDGGRSGEAERAAVTAWLDDPAGGGDFVAREFAAGKCEDAWVSANVLNRALGETIRPAAWVRGGEERLVGVAPAGTRSAAEMGLGMDDARVARALKRLDWLDWSHAPAGPEVVWITPEGTALLFGVRDLRP